MGWTTVDPDQPITPEVQRIVDALVGESASGYARALVADQGRLTLMAPTPHGEPLILHAEVIKRVTVDSWPRETSFDCYLLKTADPELMTVDGDEVTITVANGQAVYRLGPEELTAPIRPAYLVSSRLTEA